LQQLCDDGNGDGTWHREMDGGGFNEVLLGCNKSTTVAPISWLLLITDLLEFLAIYIIGQKSHSY
jgi:hypothetical protein